MYKKLLIIIWHILFLAPIFSQTASFDDQVQEFADAINPILPFAANMGLNWSTPYIGQLIGYPMHFGAGAFVGSAFMSNNEPSALGEMMGISIDESMINGKQWFPNYVIAARMGGFAGIPFDIGVKFGYLPDTALWGSLDYRSQIFGFDIHYALYALRGGGPVIAVGLGYDRLEGSVTGTVTGTVPVPGFVLTSGTSAYIVWESHTIKAQALISQTLLSTGFSFFGSIDLGVGINRAGVKFGDRDNPEYENMKDVSAMLFSGSVGVGYEIGVLHIDASFMWNFMNFESGIGFGIRYQR